MRGMAQGIVACFAVVVGLVSPLLAADLSDLIFGRNVEPLSRDYRVDIAARLDQELSSLLATIPNPTPRELDWLAAETARVNSLSEYGAQLLAQYKLTQSEIFMRADLRRRLDEICKQLELIRDSEFLEISNWTFVAIALGDPKLALWANDLEKNGEWHIPILPTLSPTAGFELEMNLDRLSMGIVRYIVVQNIMKLELTGPQPASGETPPNQPLQRPGSAGR